MPLPNHPPINSPAAIVKWTVKGPKDEEHVETAQRTKYDDWVKNICAGMHPKLAAESIGDSHYEMVNKTNKIFTIRLNQKHRVAFTIDEVKAEVNVIKLGGHYPPTKK